VLLPARWTERAALDDERDGVEKTHDVDDDARTALLGAGIFIIITIIIAALLLLRLKSLLLSVVRKSAWTVSEGAFVGQRERSRWSDGASSK
jgi:hypothetical protein